MQIADIDEALDQNEKRRIKVNFNGVISKNTPDPERNRLQLAKPFFTG